MRASIKFLQKIYKIQCQLNDYVMLSVKGPNTPWRDISLKYDKRFKDRLTKVFKQYPINEFDIYWSPMPYSRPKRRLSNALDSKFLVQDIDEHTNPKEIYPQPSYIWESSPNKYQGMWELDRYIQEEEYTPLNKSLASKIGADDCFDYTHVYRVPGTINHKYRNKPKVGFPQKTKKIYKPNDMKKIVQHRETVKIKAPESTDLKERKIFARYTIPKDIRSLLALDDLTGIDRSNTIWYIENKLYEIGMEPNEIIYLIKNSAFNKYRGRNDEDIRLKAELEKIIKGDIHPAVTEGNKPPLKVTSYHDVMANPNTFAGWLVKGFWGRRSHGIVAGMPKTFKSTIVHDLVVSVASGRPFLGKYPVLEPGPVIMVQNENADYVMKDRTEKLILHRGIEGTVTKKSKSNINIEFPEELPISFINQQGFVLNNEEHRNQLEEMIKEERPVLVVLDPLYLMFEGDLNSAEDLNPVLNWLLYLKTEYKTSVMLIHHYNKGGAGSPGGGARMMGSVLLYGWVESAWYLSKEEEEEEQVSIVDSEDDLAEGSKEPAVITMGREFRMAGGHPDIDIHFDMGELGNPKYEIDVSLAGSPSVIKKDYSSNIINLLECSSTPLSRKQLASEVGISPLEMREAVDKLIADKKIFPCKGGYTVYKSYN